jgi:hypothetical protein
MSNQLIPPPELAPPSIKHLPLQKKLELWYELLDENEALLISGLKAKVGPNGDWRAAYREWYARQMEDHDRMVATLAANLSRAETKHGK